MRNFKQSNDPSLLQRLRQRAEYLVSNRGDKVTIVPSPNSSQPTPTISPTTNDFQLPESVSPRATIIQADNVTLMVNSFSPIINLQPIIDVTTPEVTVTVAAPNVTVEAPVINIEPTPISINNQVDVKVPDIILPPFPSPVNQILVSPAEVSATLMLPESIPQVTLKPQTKTVTITGPSGNKYTGTITTN